MPLSQSRKTCDSCFVPHQGNLHDSSAVSVGSDESLLPREDDITVYVRLFHASFRITLEYVCSLKASY